jgi:hypothetical protein
MSQQAKAAAAMSEAAELKSFARPYAVWKFPKGRLELLKIGGATIGRAVFGPGRRWATSIQPIAYAKSCKQHTARAAMVRTAATTPAAGT